MSILNFERYQRQINLAEIGIEGQKKLAQSRILVIGAGGLASHLLPILVGSGVGFIRLYDGDVIDLSNLHRQTLYRMTDLGKAKVEIAKSHLQQLNSDCEIEAIPKYFKSIDAQFAFDQINLVIDAADRFATTYLLSDLCLQKNLPLISASVLGQKGYVGGFCSIAPSYRAIFPTLPKHAQSCATSGVFASAVATLASLQAHMCLNVLLDLKPSALGQLIQVDLANWHIASLRFDAATEPKQPILWLDEHEVMSSDLILELRDYQELPKDFFAHTQRIQLKELEKINLPHTQRLVCSCKTGVRATKAYNILKCRGFSNLAILAIDP